MPSKRAYIGLVVYCLLVSGCISQPTCDDNVKNGLESGVDCGGPCKPCNTLPTTTTTSMKEAGISCEDMLSGEKKDQCIYEKALKGNDERVCQIIEGDYWRNLCFRSIALEKLDQSLCERVTDDVARMECIKAVAVDSKDPEVCSLLEDDIQRDTCYYRLGQETRSNQTCEKIVSDSSRYRCLAYINKDERYCDMMAVNRSRDACYLRIASAKPDPWFCRSIYEDKLADDCLILVGEKNLNPKLCLELNNKSRQLECNESVQEAIERVSELAEQFGEGMDVVPANTNSQDGRDDPDSAR